MILKYTRLIVFISMTEQLQKLLEPTNTYTKISIKTYLECWGITPSTYLANYPPSLDEAEKRQDTLQEAIELCLTTPDCGGITSVNGGFELRESNVPIDNSGDEHSFVKPSSVTNKICSGGQSN